MSYIGLHRVKRGDKYSENIIYVLNYTSYQAMFWILRFWWICHALLFTIILFYFSCQLHLCHFRDEPEVVNVLDNISAVYDYISLETKHHWSVPVAPVHGALEEAEALASSYGIRLNS